MKTLRPCRSPIAVLSVLLAVPLAFWPFQYLSRVVRQVGGHSADLGRWMWVPVVLAVVGVATVAGLRAGGAVENSDELAPMWVVAVIAIAPCVIVLLLGWRAGESVEEAIAFAAHAPLRPPRQPWRRRRRPGRRPVGVDVSGRASMFAARCPRSRASDGMRLGDRGRARRPGAVEHSRSGRHADVLDGDERTTVVLPSQRDRAWETVDALRNAAACRRRRHDRPGHDLDVHHRCSTCGWRPGRDGIH